MRWVLFLFAAVVAMAQTREDLQARLHAAAAKTDSIVISHTWMPWVALGNERVRSIELATINSPDDLRSVVQSIQFEEPGAEGSVVDTPECYAMSMRSQGTEVLELVILGERAVSCRAFRNKGILPVDHAALQPLRRRLDEMRKRKEAELSMPPASPSHIKPAKVSTEVLARQLQDDMLAYWRERMKLGAPESNPEEMARQFLESPGRDFLVAAAEESACPTDEQLAREYLRVRDSAAWKLTYGLGFYVGRWTEGRLNLPQRILFARWLDQLGQPNPAAKSAPPSAPAPAGPPARSP